MTGCFRVPANFALANASLSWKDIKYGIENEYCDNDLAIKYAEKLMSDSEDVPEAISELVWLSNDNSVMEYVNELVGKEKSLDKDKIADKWLYLILSWLFEIKKSNADGLLRIEKIYADFDYPDSISHFVQYMPMHGQDLGSKELNQEKLVKYWMEYIHQRREVYKI